MTLYVLAAWMLAFCFAAVIGSWHGPAMAVGLPLLVLGSAAASVCPAGLQWMARRALARDHGPRPVAQQPAQAGGAPLGEAFDESLSVVLEQFHLVLFKTDVQGDILYVSRGWEAWSGRPAAGSRGLALAASLHPADRAAIDRSLRALGRGEIAHMANEVRLVSAAGSVVPLMLRAQPCLLDDGRPGGIVGTLEELTRRKRLDERLKTTRGYVNTLLANVPGMVYRSRNDPFWTMEFVSEGCVELTGYEPYELVDNQRLSFGSLIHPEDREFVWSQVQSHVAQRVPYQIAYRITDAAGRLRWVWEQARGVFSSHGELLAIEGFITDVSERRGAEEAVRRNIGFEARTGLASRAIFDSLLAWTLQHAQLTGHPCALLWVNAFGLAESTGPLDHEHEAQALTSFARRFGLAIGPGAMACYLGKNQFAVLLTDFRSAGASRTVADTKEALPAVASMADRLAQVLGAPLGHDGCERGIGVAIGIAMSEARYADAPAMLAAAQSAAQQAAKLGAGHCEFADE